MNLTRLFAALLAVGVLVGCEQAGSTDQGAAEEPMEEPASEEPMTDVEPAAEGEGEAAAEEPMTDLEPAAEGEAADEGDGSGESADGAMDASEMPADADDG